MPITPTNILKYDIFGGVWHVYIYTLGATSYTKRTPENNGKIFSILVPFELMSSFREFTFKSFKGKADLYAWVITGGDQLKEKHHSVLESLPVSSPL